MFRLAIFTTFAVVAVPLAAKDSLGVYSSWAAFRDVETPRCYAIAKPRGRNEGSAYASVATWPRPKIRNQVYLRLSRDAPQSGRVRLRVGSTNFQMVARGRNAWAPDRQTDAAIVAAMRSADVMRVSVRGVSERYDLAGVATAMDAATVGCANL